MTRTLLVALLVTATAVERPAVAQARAQDAPDLSGRWTLNRALSQFPRDIGFEVDWAPTAGSTDSAAGGGGGSRRGSSGARAGPFGPLRESEADAKRVRQLTDEVRNPPAHLTIAESPAAITVTDDRGQARTFYPSGKEDVLRLDSVPVGVLSKRDAGRLVVVYHVEAGRDLRYTYSRTASPPQLVIDVQFLERGRGDSVRRVYDPAGATENPATPPAAPAPLPNQPEVQTFNQQPDAELRGLTKLGVVVEDLSAQSTACGLNQASLETAVSKRLSDAGFTVRQNSDEDTYVYVNIITTNPSLGFCVSRYDAFLYTHTTAKLPYQTTPVLVQVSLLHRGGIAGGAAAAHTESVVRGVQEYVDQFSARIHDANK